MKKRNSLLLTLLIILFLLYILRNIDFVEVYILLKTINLFYFILAIFAAFISFLFWNLRWQNSLKSVASVKYIFLLKILFAGLFLNTITPGAGVGGEPLRAYLLKKRYNKPMSKFLGVIFADKFFHLLTYSIFLIFSLAYAIFFFTIPLSAKFLFLFILISVFFVIFYILFLTFKNKKIRTTLISKIIFNFNAIKTRFPTQIHLEKYIKSKIKKIVRIFKVIITDKQKLTLGIIYSIFFWIFRFSIFYFLFLSLGIAPNLFIIIIIISISMLFGDISPTPGGVGLLDGIIFLLFSSQGILPEIALSIALLNRIILFFYGLFIGGLCLLYIKWKKQ